jgi:hypothetical protein
MTWDELPERFRANVRVGGPDDCWEWTASRLRAGYGQYYPTGRLESKILAHRFVLEQVAGPLPPGTYGRHSCNNPPCCNPAHLSAGPPRENSLDCLRQGRNLVAKLQPNQIEMIRRIYAEMNVTQGYIGRLYGLKDAAISKIVRRSTWQHLP